MGPVHDTQPSPDYCSVSQAAERLGVSVVTLRRWDRSGKLPAERAPHTGHRRYAVDTLDQFSGRARDPAVARGRFAEKPLYDREAELADVADRLRQPGVIVTILGPPGVGKTHLATAYAHDPPRGFGLRLVELAEIASITAFRERLSALFDNHFGSVAGVVTPTIVVLDNFEHLVDGADALADVVRANHNVRFLVTSQVRLRLACEDVIELSPLRTSAAPGERLSSVPAVRMFARRAKAHGTTYDDSELTDVHGLVTRLDGLPLALELAASAARVLSPAELLERYGPQPSRLERVGGEGGGRSASLKAALDWSWSLLSGAERAALAACTVFRGGFCFSAAEAILADDLDVLSTLSALRDRSLLSVGPGSPSGGRSRFFLLGSVADFAAPSLPAEAAEGLRRRHAEHYRGLADELGIRVRQGDQAATAILAAEGGNFAAAIDYLGPSDEGVAMLSALRPLSAQGLLQMPVRELLNRLIAEASGSALGRLLLQRSVILREAGHDQRAEFERARELAREAGDAELHCEALRSLATAQPTFEAGQVYLDELREIARRHGLKQAEARGYAAAVTLACTAGWEHARANVLAALALFEELDDRLAMALMLSNLGNVEHDAGQSAAAVTHYNEALTILGSLGAKRPWAHTLGYRACLRREMGDLESAREELETALEVTASFSDDHYECLFLAELGSLRAQLGASYAGFIERAEWLTTQPSVRDSALPVTVRLHGAVTDVVLAGQALDADRVGLGHQYLAFVDDVVCEASEQIGQDVQLGASDDVRRALRVLRAARGELPAGGVAPNRLLVGRTGDWVQPPHARPIDLSSRPVLSRLLAALCRGRVEACEDAVDTATLLEAAWPGDRASAESLNRRLRTAISALRQLGLGGAIAFRGGGYLLTSGAELVGESSER